jgi:methyl-accepting chemotaxis protein/cytochrome b561
MALLVLAQLALALALTQLRSLSFGQNVLALHQQLGLAVLVLVVARLVMARRDGIPAPAAGLPHWQHVVAQLTHRGFLLLLIAQPLLGMGVAWARGVSVRPLGLFDIPAPLEFSDAMHDWFMRGHIVAAVLLMALVAVHIGAVAFNRMRRGVSVIDRMLPPRRAGELRNRMPIVLQLALAFGLVMTVAASASAFAVHRYRTVTALQAQLQAGDVKALESLRGAQVSWKDMLARPAAADAAQVGELATAAATAAGEAASLASTPAVRGPLGELARRMARFDAAAAGSQFAALQDIDAKLQEAVDLQSAALFQLRTEHDELAARGHDLIVVAMLPLVLAGTLVALLLTRSMTGSLERMRGLVRAVQEGRHDVNMNAVGGGEFSLLLREMLGMSRALQQRTAEEAERQRARDLEHARELQQGRERELAARAAAELKEQQERAHQESQRRVQQEREAAERLEQAARDRVAREQQRRELAAQFEAQMAGVVAGLEETVSGLRATADEMARLAAANAQRSQQAERMAGETNSTAAEVARGASSLSESADRMRGQAQGSRAGAMLAVSEAAEAGAAIRGLVDATGQIGQIAETIADIARQTTLLSINARVEAARAGEAGRGFAIVATEVKDLASRTRQATDGIEAHIRQVTSAAQGSISFMQRVGQRIEELGESAGSILQCAEDQCGATGQISERMAAITRSTGSVVASVQAAKGTASETEQMAGAVLAAAARMQEQTRRMQEQVADFVLEIGAARAPSGARATGADIPAIRPAAPAVRPARTA